MYKILSFEMNSGPFDLLGCVFVCTLLRSVPILGLLLHLLQLPEKVFFPLLLLKPLQ